MLTLFPALWLLGSVIFLLSRAVPGTATEILAEEAASNSVSSNKAEIRKQAYASLLHRTGQDLPLFYFRLGTAAEPDSLSRIFPETERRALKQLVLTYGNWPEISAYYKSLSLTRKVAAASALPPAVQKDLRFYLNSLLKTGSPAEIKRIFAAQKAALSMPEARPVLEKVLRSEAAFREVVQTQNPALNYQPRIFWYGTQNQYHRWLSQVFQGNLGYSIRDARPVTEIITEALSVTGWLALGVFLLVSLLGPAIGMFLSRKSKTNFQKPVLGFFYLLESLPLFVIGLAVLSLLSYWGLFEDFPEEAALLSAGFCLVLVNLPYLVGQSFAAFQKELNMQYVLTARAKGFSDKQVLTRHALRNSLLPVITALSDFFPALLAGALVLEVIFSLPGTGQLLVNAVLSRDYEVVTSLVLLVGFVKILSHLLADLLYAFTDPRIRHSA